MKRAPNSRFSVIVRRSSSISASLPAACATTESRGASRSEMAATLRRSAYSTNIKTRADFSCAFFDSQLRPVAQAFATSLDKCEAAWKEFVRAYK